MYSVCGGVSMVSCKCDGVLPDDSGSAIAFIDFFTYFPKSVQNLASRHPYRDRMVSGGSAPG